MSRSNAMLPWICTLAAAFAVAPPAWSQQVNLPSLEDVKELKARYESERANLVRDGIAKKFSPSLLDKAAEWAERAEKARADGRIGQAAASYRHARWQLPYAPKGLPDHVAWVSGNFRLRHDFDVSAAAYSPDGRLLATGSSDHTIKIWDLANGHELLAYKGHTDPVRALTFSPDGKSIASAQGGTSIKGDGAPIRLWDIATGNDLRTFPGKGFQASSLIFSKDGKFLIAGFLAVGIDKHSLCVYETATGKLHRVVEDLLTPVTSVALN